MTAGQIQINVPRDFLIFMVYLLMSTLSYMMLNDNNMLLYDGTGADDEGRLHYHASNSSLTVVSKHISSRAVYRS